MANKAIIGITQEGEMYAELKELARRIEAGERLPEADYHLSFSSAAQLFSELTPARMRTLEFLKREGPLTFYALAKRLGRNYSNVHHAQRLHSGSHSGGQAPPRAGAPGEIAPGRIGVRVGETDAGGMAGAQEGDP